ncbi:MAG TPA: alpha/beta hydrolase [Terriglobales bacterium]|nr:alpha/beta hydrolase [Terriglobales bacterium]
MQSHFASLSPEAFEHRFVQVNGIRIHYVEAGSGPLVLLCHGFPEIWYAWRHQIPALASARFRAVAPDLRGYGQTEAPMELDAYDIFQLTGDLVGLVHALGESSAIIVGHDWGAWLASYVALFRPDMFRALVLLSVPYVPRRTMSQSQWEQQAYPGKIFYQAALRSPGAEIFFQADIRNLLLRTLYSMSGNAPPGSWNFIIDPSAPRPAVHSMMPAWIREADINYVASEFERSGFTGGLNYYRNMDRNWSLTPFLAGAKILQPTLFIAGDKDPVIEFHGQEFRELGTNVPNLRKKVLLPEVGHWTQQERPEEANKLLLDFLKAES